MHKYILALSSSLLTIALVDFFNDRFLPLPHVEDNLYKKSGKIEEKIEDINEGKSLDFWLQSADINRGKELFQKCSSCHSLEDAPNTIGPAIMQIHGEKIAENVGKNQGYAFSQALKKKNTESWTDENLNKFLHSPQSFSPGTKMTFIGIKKAQDRADIIKLLQK